MTKFVKIVFGAVIAFSLAGNLYFFGYQWYSGQIAKAYQKGAMDLQTGLIEQLKKGSIPIMDNTGKTIMTINGKMETAAEAQNPSIVEQNKETVNNVNKTNEPDNPNK